MRALLVSLLASLAFTTAGAADPAPAEVAAALRRCADWQLANPGGMDTRFWVLAPFYDGLLRTVATDAR